MKKAGDIVIESENLHLASLERDRIIDILYTEDPSLHLYRDKATREAVEFFFTELAGSERVARPILHYADQYDVSFFLAFSVAFIESEFNPRAINRNPYSVDRGVFQLNSNSFPGLGEKEFFDPVTNAKYGISHLKLCLEEGKNPIVAVAIYNAGKRRVTQIGTPVVTLEYIGKYVDYRRKLEDSFRDYMRDVLRAPVRRISADTRKG
jgi:hypothetical protein